MMSDTQTAALPGFPLVIPTSTQQPLARLVLRNDLGQVIQQWLVKQNKCTLGSAASCSLRCTEAGIAPYHALIVVGARQTFVRALAPRVTREGAQVNEILLSDSHGNFEIAGHHFELTRGKPDSKADGTQQEPSNGRLKFTLARPFELNKRTHKAPSTTEPVSQRPIDDQVAPWVAKLVQSAVEPLESQLRNMLAPLAELQSESRRQKRLRRQRIEAKRKQAAEGGRHELGQSGTGHDNSSEPEFTNSANASIEALAARQTASMETLGERIADISNQLAAIERLAAEEREPELTIDPGVQEKLLVQHDAIEQLQSGIVAVSSAIQDLHERREAAQNENTEWKSEIQQQLAIIAAGVKEAEEREPRREESPVVLAAIEKLRTSQAKSQQDIETWKDQIQEQIQAIRSWFTESTEGQASRDDVQDLKSKMLENLKSLKESLEAIQTNIATPVVSQPATAHPPADDSREAFSARVDAISADATAIDSTVADHDDNLNDSYTDDEAVEVEHCDMDTHEKAPDDDSPEPTVSNHLESSWPTFDVSTSQNESDEPATSEASSDEPSSEFVAAEHGEDQTATEATFADDLSDDVQITDEYELRGESITESTLESESDEVEWLNNVFAWNDSEVAEQPISNEFAQNVELAIDLSTESSDDKFSYDSFSDFDSVPVEALYFSTLTDEEPAELQGVNQDDFDNQAYPDFEPVRTEFVFDGPWTEESEKSSEPAATSLPEWWTDDERLENAESGELWGLTGELSVSGELSAQDNSYAPDSNHERLVPPEQNFAPEQIEGEEVLGLGVDETQTAKNIVESPSVPEDINISEEPEGIDSSLANLNSTPEASKPAEEPEDEDSVEDYMRKLLARMRGVPENQIELPAAKTPYTPTPTPASPPTQIREPKQEAKESEAFVSPAPASTRRAALTVGETGDVTAAFDPEKYVPRALAQEGNNNLAAMRELANSSARTAIHESTRQRRVTSVLLKLSIAGVGIFVAAVLLAINGLAVNVGLIATFASIVVAVIWGYDGINSLKPLLQSELVLKPHVAKSDAIGEETEQ